MLYSMTGYGQSISQNEKYSCKVDIRALNNKNNELNIRLPTFVREREADIRSIVSDAVLRGKTDVNLYLESQTSLNSKVYNNTLVKSIYTEIETLTQELHTTIQDPLAVILQLPECKNMQNPQVDDDLFEIVKKTLLESIHEFFEFRKREGEKMEKDILTSLENIKTYKTEVSLLEPARAQQMRSKLSTKLDSISREHSIENDRLEQEIIFYLEKLDINEEIIRLQAHLDYFVEICKEKNQLQKGKKLAFVSQEIGREINTIGSKANDASIQRLVVNMKDELEKIKEMLNNVL